MYIVWVCKKIWKALYYNFLSKNRKTIYVRNISYLNKMNNKYINEMKKSKNFIEKYIK